MTRALATFKVTRRAVCVRVRVLADTCAVDAAYRKADSKGRRWHEKGQTHAFTGQARAGQGVVVMTLPLAHWTPGLVAHECRHVIAVYDWSKHDDPEEMEATVLGELTDSICTRLTKIRRQYEVVL